jgi:hypothetical protein
VLTGLGLNAYDILVVYIECGVQRDSGWAVLVMIAMFVVLLTRLAQEYAYVIGELVPCLISGLGGER